MIDLEAEVMKILDDYVDGVQTAVAVAIPTIAKATAKKVKAAAPRKSGKYAKGWTSKTEMSRTGASAVVYGKNGTYQLAHLLEHGHAKRGGGRVAGQVHIKPAEEWAVAEVEKAVREAAGR